MVPLKWTDFKFRNVFLAGFIIYLSLLPLKETCFSTHYILKQTVGGGGRESNHLKTFHPPRILHEGSHLRYHINNMPNLKLQVQTSKSYQPYAEWWGLFPTTQLCYAARFGGVQFLHPGVSCWFLISWKAYHSYISHLRTTHTFSHRFSHQSIPPKKSMPLQSTNNCTIFRTFVGQEET